VDIFFRIVKFVFVWFITTIPTLFITSFIFPAGPDNMMSSTQSAIVLILPVVCAVLAVLPRKQKNIAKNHVPVSEDNSSAGKPSASLTLSAAEFSASTLLDAAAMVIFDTDMASISMIERRLNLPYKEAAECIAQLEAMGVISPFDGSTPRRVLITKEAYLATRPQQRQSVPSPRPPQNSYSDEFSKYGGIDAELLTIDLMDGHSFEYWCANLLRKIGFTNVEVTPGSGDQGVDILAQKEGIKYAIQCKCYTSDLGNTPIQEVHAGKAMYHCQVGAVMTNRHFTFGGRQLAEATGTLLWDRDWIADHLKQLNSSERKTLEE